MSSSDNFISGNLPNLEFEGRGGAGALEGNLPTLELTSDAGAVLSGTLANLSFSAGTVTSPFTHTRDLLLPTLELSATVPAEATLDVKLPNLTFSADAGGEVATANLPTLEFSGSIDPPRVGNIDGTLSLLSMTSEGGGTLNLPARLPQLRGAGTLEYVGQRSGEISGRLPTLEVTASSLDVHGSLDVKLPPLEFSGSGYWANGAPGSLTANLVPLKLSASGDVLYAQQWNLSVKLPGLTGTLYGVPSTEGSLSGTLSELRGAAYTAEVSRAQEVTTEVSPIFPDDDEVLRWT